MKEYTKAIQDFEGKIVEVKDVFGDVVRGLCIAVGIQHLNIILRVKNDIIVIKNPQSIRREDIMTVQTPMIEKPKEVVEEKPVKKKQGRPKKSGVKK